MFMMDVMARQKTLDYWQLQVVGNNHYFDTNDEIDRGIFCFRRSQAQAQVY